MGKSHFALLVLLFAVLAPTPVPAATVIPAIQKVLTMLENLVSTLQKEGQDDEEKFSHFTKWVAKEQEETSTRISTLQTQIEDTKAVLSTLRSQQGELMTSVANLKSEIATTTNQINTATEKRNEEHSSFVTEQTNFDQAIKACDKAVEILAQHYGDGTEAEVKKPDWMSLLSKSFATIRHAKSATRGRAKTMKLSEPKLSSFLQGPYDRFEAKTGDAMNIVDQVKVLGTTFAEDKQSSIEEEARLQEMYDGLMKEKQAILAELQSELADQTQRLNQVNQDIASNESQLQMYEKNLADAQEYLKNITEQLKMFTEAFNHRKKDREEELEAVNQALKVLDKYNTEFVQLGSQDKHQSQQERPQVPKAIMLLKQKAAMYHSSLLEAAAAATAGLGNDAIKTIITNLEGLIGRIDEEQKAETEHKEWCEKETGLTTAKRDDHRYICEDLKNILANLKEVVVEKTTDIGINRDDKNTEDTGFAERQQIRNDEHHEFELDLEEHVEAIQALNEAIDILAKYYASRDAKGASLIQQGFMGPRGTGVVNMLSETRHEFEEAKVTLETDEAEAVTEFNEQKQIHIKTDMDLDSDKDTLTVEKQTTEDQIDVSEDDLKTNQEEVQTAENYLDRLGKSCYPLIARYDKRKELRAEERKAIQDAIKVLEEEA